jgi:hypothetical protein
MYQPTAGSYEDVGVEELFSSWLAYLPLRSDMQVCVGGEVGWGYVCFFVL